MKVWDAQQTLRYLLTRLIPRIKLIVCISVARELA
jgi:hypothetical protein